MKKIICIKFDITTFNNSEVKYENIFINILILKIQ